jgi:ferritin-like metal-binding protein YciE
MEMRVLEDLLLHDLAELYGAEQQIVKALPRMMKGVQNAELRAAFELHLKQTGVHVQRLDRIFKMLGTSPEAIDSPPISEIFKQAETLITNKQADPAILDAAITASAQRVEHYEIAVYGTVLSHARFLGYMKIGDILRQTLREEEQTDALLGQIARRRVNVIAAKAPFAEARTGTRGCASRGWGLGGFFSVLAIGAAAALLYSPKSREQTRRELKAKAEGNAAEFDQTGARSMDDEGYIHTAS